MSGTVQDISAVFFDMDGTLIDSETLTEPAIRSVCCECGIEANLIDYPDFFGVSWENIERTLIDIYPRLSLERDLPQRLHQAYHQLLQSHPPDPILNARDSLIAASQLMPTAIVSSSGRASISATIQRLRVRDHVSFYAGFEDYASPKPAPDAYLHAADAAGVEPAECLVFEDSIVGIEAARAAGMQVVAVTFRSNDVGRASELADLAITDYSELPAGFFQDVWRGSSAHVR